VAYEATAYSQYLDQQLSTARTLLLLHCVAPCIFHLCPLCTFFVSHAYFLDSGRCSAPSVFVMRHHNTSIDRLTLLLYGASCVGHQSPTSINANMFMEELILKLVELRTTISRQLLTHDSIIQDIAMPSAIPVRILTAAKVRAVPRS
jgi:hypothetical protein